MTNNFAFIDGQNLHFGIKSLGWKLDHKKFRQYLEEEHDVTKAYIFLGYMEEHQDLYNVLQEAGFICFFKPLVRYDDGTIKGNVDADMVLQVMVDIEKYDGAVIISGDGDFSGMLRHLLTHGKLGQVIIPNRDKYSSLFDRLDGFDEKHVTYMNDLRNKLQYRPGKRNYNGNKKSDSRNSKPNDSKKTSSPAPRKSPVKSAPAKAPAQSKSTDKKPTRAKQGSKPPAKRNNRRKQSETGFKPKAVLEQNLIDTINSVEQ